MAVSYKKLQHLMIDRNISNAELMRRANISANIITKIRTGQYIALDKVESICLAMCCTPNDILEFVPDEEQMKKMTKQVKSKKRVAEHGEVFTAEREVKAMCDLVKQETERIDSRFLEPACGNGNFLAEILSRKLAVVRKKYKKSPYDWERNSLLALGSLYGVDLLIDNCIECRQRLFEMWDKEYKAICKKECNDDTREAAKFILSRNIVCGNTLTLKCVDENGKDTNEPIVFSEWTFPFNNALMQRSDYTFAELLATEEERPKRKKKKDEPEQISLMLDEDIREAPSDEGVFLKKCISHYRRIQENG